MYDFDMMESFYDDFDDDEFTEACVDSDFDDLFVENEDGSYGYIGDIYTEAFGKKKKSGFSLPSIGGKKKRSGFSLGGNKKKKKKKKAGKLPPAAKVTAEVAAVLAIGAGAITLIKKIMREKFGIEKKSDFTEFIDQIKADMKELKKQHKEYIKGEKNLTKEQKEFISKDLQGNYKDAMKEKRRELNMYRMFQFCSNKLNAIKLLCKKIRGIGTKIMNQAKKLNIPVPWADKVKEKPNSSVSNTHTPGTALAVSQESAFIEAVVNSFVQESAELLEDDTDYLYDDVYESVLSDLYDEDDYDDYEESYEDDFDDLF